MMTTQSLIEPVSNKAYELG